MPSQVTPTETAAAVNAIQGSTGLPYPQFLEERHRILEARSRAQQRVDQLVTGGAAGALVLSITFLEKIAPHPNSQTQLILLSAWGLLLLSLGLGLGSHYASCRAFDVYLAAFDKAYEEDSRCVADSPAARATVILDQASAGAFVVGVALLAWFAFMNVQFTGSQTRESNGSSGTTSTVTPKRTVTAPNNTTTTPATTSLVPRKDGARR